MIDVDKFVASLIKHYCEAYGIDRTSIRCWFDDALEEQGLQYKDGEIVKTQRRIAAEAKEAIFDNEDERIRKKIIALFKGQIPSTSKEDNEKFVAWLEKQGKPQDKGEISDGYHTFNELYYYRMLYNAAFFNMLPKEWVHKSKKHHDGEDCFGGGWFIVMANLPTGQISNHYELKDWDLFHVPEKEVADKWDGHTPQEAADRLHKYLLEKQGSTTKLNEEKENKLAKSVLISCAMSFINYLDAHKYDGKMCVSNGECEDIENSFLNAMWDRLHRYYCKYIEKQVEQKTIDIESMVKAYKQRIIKQDNIKNNPLIDMCLACFKHGVETTLGELNCEQILANSAKTCKNEQNGQTNFFQNVSLTEFEEALADVCRGWIGEEIGWKDYIVKNANALLKICQKMWNEIQDAPFEQKPAWSDDDEEELSIAIQYLQLEGQYDSINWLKSLKERLKGE